jgi:hypothetical protein
MVVEERREAGVDGSELLHLVTLAVTVWVGCSSELGGQRSASAPSGRCSGEEEERCEGVSGWGSSFYRRGRQREGEPAVALPNGWPRRVSWVT